MKQNEGKIFFLALLVSRIPWLVIASFLPAVGIRMVCLDRVCRIDLGTDRSFQYVLIDCGLCLSTLR